MSNRSHCLLIGCRTDPDLAIVLARYFHRSLSCYLLSMQVSARTPLAFQLAETSMRLDSHNSSLHKYLAMRLVSYSAI